MTEQDREVFIDVTKLDVGLFEMKLHSVNEWRNLPAGRLISTVTYTLPSKDTEPVDYGKQVAALNGWIVTSVRNKLL